MRCLPFFACIGWVFVAVASACFASETDNLTLRPNAAELADQEPRERLNLWTNEALDKVLLGLKDCDFKSLHLAVKDALGGGVIGRLELWATSNSSIHKLVVSKEDSIYAEAGLAPGFATGILGTRSLGISLVGIFPSVVVNGHLTGVDKFGHFADQGYAYYEDVYLRHAPEFTALETLGLEDELGFNGMVGNGVLSYADMAANFAGFLFWRNVVGGPDPYFACVGKKFVRTARRFDWGEYVSEAWDEGLNCSEYSEVVGAAVRRSKGYKKCPLDPTACQKILNLPCGLTYMSPSCAEYVQLPGELDAACSKLIREDDERAVCSEYQPGLLRTPVLVGITDALGSVQLYVDGKVRKVRFPLLRRLGP
jgi:hypothetical protein